MKMAKKLGAITIDEKKQRFKIEGDASSAETSGLGKKLVKGTLAVATVGASVVAEKAVKGGANALAGMKWYDFNELLKYQVRMDNQRERVSGSTKLFGIRQSGSTTKSVTHSMDIIVTLDSLDHPTITIPIIKKPLSGRAFDNAVKYGDETKAGLDYILRHK